MTLTETQKEKINEISLNYKNLELELNYLAKEIERLDSARRSWLVVLDKLRERELTYYKELASELNVDLTDIKKMVTDHIMVND